MKTANTTHAAYRDFLRAKDSFLLATDRLSGLLARDAGMGRTGVHVIQGRVARDAGLTVEELVTRSRRARYVKPRQLGIWLCRVLTQESLTDIGEAFGYPDHGSVMHAIRTVGDRIETEPKYAAMVKPLREELALELERGGK